MYIRNESVFLFHLFFIYFLILLSGLPQFSGLPLFGTTSVQPYSWVAILSHRASNVRYADLTSPAHPPPPTKQGNLLLSFTHLVGLGSCFGLVLVEVG